jgi:hypothetical protein
MLKTLKSLLRTVTNWDRTCFKKVRLVIIEQGKLNHGAVITIGRDKNIYVHVVGNHKSPRSILEMKKRYRM